MDRTAGELSTVHGAAIARFGDAIKVTWESDLLFDLDSAMLRLDSQEIIRPLADILTRSPRTEIVIAAHTDSAGPDDYNRKLSERRAISLRDCLVDLGVAPSRITTEGHGGLLPVAANDAEEGRRLNRRVEIEIRERKN